MSRAATTLRRGLLPACVAAALAFGAAQALASPRPVTQAKASCSDEHCDANCVARGFAYGSCATGACRCFN